MGDKSNDLIEQLKFGKINLLWVGSGHMVDNLIHQIDECCWLMDDWPVSCHGMGGREVGNGRSRPEHRHLLDGVHLPERQEGVLRIPSRERGHSEFATFVHCSKKAGQFSGNVHKATVHMFKDQRISKDNIAWSPTPDAKVPGTTSGSISSTASATTSPTTKPSGPCMPTTPR